MLEVEAKIPIGRSELAPLRRKLLKMASFCEKRVSQDWYYIYSSASHVRIRKSANKSVFTVKGREVKKGIEANRELEWGITDLNRWRALLLHNGLHPLRTKYKKSEIYRVHDFSIELNFVRKLGYYLEIEKLVPTAGQVPKAKKDLIALFRKIGYSQERFEPRPYLQLLANV